MMNYGKTKVFSVVLMLSLVVLGMFLAGCKQQPKEEVIKIGAIAPLSGEAASWGQNGVAGMKLAVQEINNKGGINGKKIELIVEDSKCTSDSVSAIQKLVNIDKVNAIVGFVCSAAAGPALPIAKDNNIPVVLIAASAPHLTKIGDNIFRIYPSDSAQGKFAAEFIFDKLGKRKVAVLYVKNDWGEGIYNVFSKRFKELGGEIVYDAGVLQKETDFRTEISKIKNTDAEALYFPVYPANAIAALKQMNEMDLNIPVIGGDITGGEDVVQSGYADGFLYTTGKINLPEEFKSKVSSLSGFESLSVNILAPLGYDGIKVMALAIQKAGSIDKTKIKNALATLKYNGISSPTIEFDENGDLKTPIFEVKKVENKQSVPWQG